MRTKTRKLKALTGRAAFWRTRLARHLPLLLALLLIAVCGAGTVVAEEAAATDKNEATKITFPPDVEAKLADFLKKVTESKRKVWELRMKKETDEVAKVTGLNAGGTKALEPAAGQAVDQCMEGWAAKEEKLFHASLTQSPTQALQTLDQMLSQVDAYTKNEMGDDCVRPTEHPAWTGALQRTLTVEQAAAWDKAQAERKQSVEKEIAECLKAGAEHTREEHSQLILAKSAEIALVLTLPKERAEQLDLLAKQTADKTAEDSRSRADKALLAMDDEQRHQITKNARSFFYIPIEKKDLPDAQAMWNEGLAKLLSPDELKQLKDAQEERKSRRFRIMGRIMLVLLDEKIALTTSQRQQLQPIAERLVREQMSSLLENQSEYGGIAPQSFFTATSKAPEEEVKPILDAVQWKHWQDLSKPPNNEANPKKSDAYANPPPQTPDPDDTEAVISDFFQEKTAAKHRRLLATMVLKAEDAARVAQLPAEAANRLQTAARGEAEESLAAWKSSVDQFIRSNFLRDVTPQNIKQQLASINDYYFEDQFSMGNGNPNNKETTWDATVNAELTEPQKVVWQKEVDDRNAYREKAIASALMAEFDRRHPITAEQWEKIEPVIAGIVKDYSPEIGNYFSGSNEVPWYLEYYSMYFPFAGVPEKEFKTILTKAQWDHWTGSQEFSNGSNQWENFQQNHAQRAQSTQRKQARNSKEKSKDKK